MSQICPRHVLDMPGIMNHSSYVFQYLIVCQSLEKGEDDLKPSSVTVMRTSNQANIKHIHIFPIFSLTGRIGTSVVRQLFIKTSLPRRLQVRTLPNATPPIGNINPVSKIGVTVEPMMRFCYSLMFGIS